MSVLWFLIGFGVLHRPLDLLGGINSVRPLWFLFALHCRDFVATRFMTVILTTRPCPKFAAQSGSIRDVGFPPGGGLDQASLGEYPSLLGLESILVAP